MPLVVSVEAHLSVKSPARKDQTGSVCYLAAVALKHKVVQTNVAHKREAKIMITKKNPAVFFSISSAWKEFSKSVCVRTKGQKKHLSKEKQPHTCGQGLGLKVRRSSPPRWIPKDCCSVQIYFFLPVTWERLPVRPPVLKGCWLAGDGPELLLRGGKKKKKSLTGTRKFQVLAIFK